MKRSCTSIVLLLVAAVIAGCDTVDEEQIAQRTAAVTELSDAQQRQQGVALAARDALFQQLLGKLMETMASSGPAAAIEVCQEQAPAIATQVSEQFGVTIGRTSHRLRNPKNEAPEWRSLWSTT